MGRVLIANFSTEELNKFISKYGLPTQEEWPEIKGSEKSLRQQLKKINEQGYAIILNNEEVIGFAVPIIHNGQTAAGIGMYMPAFRFKKAHQKKIIQSLVSTAAAIAKKL